MSDFTPEPGAFCLYRERGGVNWFLCKVIAYHENKVWLHNLSVGSMPVKNVLSVDFKLDFDTAAFLSGKH